MVFQNYALYPHMTVRREHGLLADAEERAEGRDRRSACSAPPRSSASCRCSTAIRASSRAASASASPWAAPSCATRRSSCSTSRCPTSTPSCASPMRAEIKELHQRLKTTTVYVTHDQIEAMTMADKIVVMHDGIVEQIGAPLDLYDRPGQSVRRRLHRLAGDELLQGQDRARRRDALRRRRRHVACRSRDARRSPTAQPIVSACGPSICSLSDDGIAGRGRRRRADRLGDPAHRPHAGGEEIVADFRERHAVRARRDDPALGRSGPRSTSSTARPASGSETTSTPGGSIDQAKQQPGGDDHEIHQTRRHPHHRRRRRRHRSAARYLGAPAFAQDAPTFTPEEGATLRLLRWAPFVQGDEDAWLANTKTLHRRDRRPGAHRQGKLGGHPPEGRGRRQCRLRPRHDDGLVRRPAPVSRQAARRDRPRRLSRRQVWRLVRRPEGLRHARRQVHRPAARRHRQRHRLPRQPGQGGRLLRVPEGHGGLPRALQGDAEANGHPAGFTARQGVGDGNNYAHWLLWSHGGKMVDESGKVVDQQPRDAWRRSNMRRSSTRPSSPAPRAGSTSTTTAPSWPARSRSPPTASRSTTRAKNDPKLAEIAKDIRTHQPADRPGRQVGRAAPDDDRRRSSSTRSIPNAAKAYLQFMFEERADERLDQGSPAPIAASR